MGVLDRFEKRLDRLVNGAFARTFKAEVEPVEVAAALQRECDDRAAIVDRNRRVVPNVFTVELGPHDYERLQPYAAPLGAEFATMVREHAEEAGYTFFGPVDIELSRAEDLDTGLFRIRSDVRASADAYPPAPAAPATPLAPVAATARQPQAPTAQPTGAREGTPSLEHDGQRWALRSPATTIGRAPECDIQIDDPGISRSHARIELDPDPVVIDLGSTNGTWVDGRRVQRAPLRDGSSLALGSTTFLVRLGR
ncbi:MAG TPA: DUF3662 and FHA domain-containing protein [Actinomycetes bacterium]|nr:DUF3662 and FHA domain-containing protein [Actinomycetes bacterium]